MVYDGIQQSVQRIDQASAEVHQSLGEVLVSPLKVQDDRLAPFESVRHSTSTFVKACWGQNMKVTS
jgi:hypothetical protein